MITLTSRNKDYTFTLKVLETLPYVEVKQYYNYRVLQTIKIKGIDYPFVIKYKKKEYFFFEFYNMILQKKE